MDRTTLLSFLVLLSTGPLSTANADTISPAQIRVIDGDTVQLGTERIRLLEIDAPEIHTPRCEAEAARGAEATRFVERLVASGRDINVERSGKQDKYGRTLAHLSVNGEDVGQALLTAGLAVRWRPGHAAWVERERHWCGTTGR